MSGTIACMEENSFEELTSLKRQKSLLHSAAYQGEYAMVAQMLREKIYDINGHDPLDGRTPLIEAVRGGHNSMVALLIHHKAGIHDKDTYDRTALSYAAENSYNDDSLPNYLVIVALLLTHGAQSIEKNGSSAHTWDRHNNNLLYFDYAAYLNQNPDLKNKVDALDANYK